MKNTYGQSVCLTIFGESHGTAIGAILDGLAAGIKVDEEFMYSQMQRRKGKQSISTARREEDKVNILSGVFNGYTTGTAICLEIDNNNTKSRDYSATKDLARPSHADYTAYVKYHGYQDYRGGGHFSGRLTAPIVAAGSICLDILRRKGILIGTHILSCGGIKENHFSDYEAEINKLMQLETPVIDDEKRVEIENRIEQARENKDSVGGVLESVILNLPVGLGEPMFDSLESVISHGLFSIPAIKGVEFGAGFQFADMMGSEANDPFRMEDGKVVTSTNNNGGINGGIANGMPVTIRCAVKPTPSIYQKQQTIDFIKNENTDIEIVGRHDPAIIHRAAVVVDSMLAIIICDQLAQHFGTDYLRG